MEQLNKLEARLESVFKGAPKLPENAVKTIVSWLPWINLVLGIFSLWAAYALWHWAHQVNSLVNYLNGLSAAYGGSATTASNMTAGLWLALIVIAFEGVLFLMAFPATQAKSKRGWSLMFYAALVNLVYGIVLLFTDYGSTGNFLGYLVGTVLGLWILFQIKPKYVGSK